MATEDIITEEMNKLREHNDILIRCNDSFLELFALKNAEIQELKNRVRELEEMLIETY